MSLIQKEYSVSFFINRQCDENYINILKNYSTYQNIIKNKFEIIKNNILHNNNKSNIQQKNSNIQPQKITSQSFTKNPERKLPERPLQKMNAFVNEKDMHIQMIKSILNKISNKNFDEEFINLQNSISFLERNDWVSIVFQMFFANKFLIDIYFKVFKKLIENNNTSYIIDDFFSLILNNDNYLNQIVNLKFINPDDNYDEFCKINYINDKNKNISSFLSLLVNNGIIQNNVFLQFVDFILQKIDDWKNDANKIEHNNELIENLIILIKGRTCEFLGNERFNLIKNLQSYKPKIYKGISSKAYFKLIEF